MQLLITRLLLYTKNQDSEEQLFVPIEDEEEEEYNDDWNFLDYELLGSSHNEGTVTSIVVDKTERPLYYYSNLLSEKRGIENDTRYCAFLINAIESVF